MKKDQRADILNYIIQGYSQKEACKKAGVAEGTFYRWCDEDKEFREQVRSAQDEARISKADVRAVEQSLLDIARGFEYEEVKTEYESREVVDEVSGKKEFKPVIKKQVRTQKRVIPNVEAIKFLLTNRDPDNWKNRVDQTQMGNVETNLVITCKGEKDHRFPHSESELDLTRNETGTQEN
jgi:transposase